MVDAAAFTSGTFAYTQGIAKIGEVNYTCVDFSGTFYVNKLPHVKLTLTTAYEEVQNLEVNRVDGIPKTYNDLFDVLLATKYGDEVTVSYLISYVADNIKGTLPKGVEVTIFSGVLASWAPVWINDRLQITVWAAHPLELLHTASPIADSIHGKGWPDYTQSMVAELQGDITSFSPGKYTASDATTDLWKSVIKKMLVDRLSNKVFGEDANETLLEYLNADDNDLSRQELSLKVGDGASAVAYCRRTLYRGDLTPWQALVQIAREFNFCIVPLPVGFRVIPTLPTIGGEAPEQILETIKYQRRVEHNHRSLAAHESTVILQQASDYTGFFDSTVCEFYNDADIADDIRGVTIVKPAAWSTGLYAQPTLTAGTMGLTDTVLSVAGCKIATEDSAVEDTRNSLRNEYVTDVLAAELETGAGYHKYEDRTLVLRGSLDFDVAPGNINRVEIAGYTRESADAEFTEYYVGFVRAVKMCLGADGTAASTWVLMTNLRTRQEQSELETEKHPMYNKRWIRAPLIEIEKITTEEVFS